MSTTFPLTTLAAQITATGVSYPTMPDTLSSLQASYQNIYGSDVYLGADSQDGQWLAFLAQAIYDENQAIESAYLNMNPDNAVGVGLSSLVKLNGLKRDVSTNSTVVVLLGGAVGTTITNGQVFDASGNVWNLPASVTIGIGGTVTVTATAVLPGAITAAINTVSIIATPTLGWSSVINSTGAATPGAPVELDPALRSRQTLSTALPAQTVLQGIVATVTDITGVLECIGYENDTGSVNSLGLPAHSISIVVSGGDSSAIATAINLKKTPGSSTYGTTSITITDLNGLPKVINFYVPTTNQLQMAVTINPLAGYTTTVGNSITQALVKYIASLSLGGTVYYSRLWVPAQLNLTGQYSTYEITSLQICVLGGTLGTSDIAQNIYQEAVLQASNIALTVL